MLPGQVSIAAWLPHVRSSFIWWRHFSSGESLGDESKDYTQTHLSPHCANYLSVLWTFIKRSNNIIPTVLDTDSAWKQYFLHFNYRWSWPDGTCLGRSIIPWPTAKTKFKICTNLLTYFAFQPQHRERATQLRFERHKRVHKLFLYMWCAQNHRRQHCKLLLAKFYPNQTSCY